MSVLYALVCSVVGLLVSWLAVSVLRRGVVGKRESGRAGEFHHAYEVPVSRLGGVALAGAFLVVWLAADAFLPEIGSKNPSYPVIVLGALAMFSVGIWDDVRPLGAKRKLILQVLVASGVYGFGIQIMHLRVPFTGVEIDLGMWGFVATVFWLVAMTNLFNLIDGIDGLAGGLGFMLMCLLASVCAASEMIFLSLVAAGMAGALLGFLRYNFPPARIYMGDGGAYFVGFLIGLLSIETSNKGTVAAALMAPMFALALPISDTTLALVRRALKGLPLFRPDREHIHHRLVKQCISRRRAVLLLYSFSLVFLLLAFGVFWLEGKLLPVLYGVAILTLLLAFRAWGLLPDFFALGAVWNNTLQLRKESRYALSLGNWLEIEAERCSSVREIWLNYQFVARKMGFVCVTLALGESEERWQAEAQVETADYHRRRLKFIGGRHMNMEFQAPTERLSRGIFEHQSDLAAEIWLKAALRWQSTTGLPVHFDSCTAAENGHGEAAQTRCSNRVIAPTAPQRAAESLVPLAGVPSAASADGRTAEPKEGLWETVPHLAGSAAAAATIELPGNG